VHNSLDVKEYLPKAKVRTFLLACSVPRSSNRAAERDAFSDPSIYIHLSICLYLPVSCVGVQTGQQNDTRRSIHLYPSIYLAVYISLFHAQGFNQGSRTTRGFRSIYLYPSIYLSVYISLFHAQGFNQGSRTTRGFRSIYLYPSIYLSVCIFMFRAQGFNQGSRTTRGFRSIYLYPSIYLSVCIFLFRV